MKPVLYEASAGTGKTWRIAQLVLDLVVREGMPIEQILVVTFTEAAAAHLRERVRRRLSEGSDAIRRWQSDPEFVPHDDVELASALAQAHAAGELGNAEHRVETALRAFDRATIVTMHSFCSTVLDRFALDCKVPFDVELIGGVASIAEEIARDFWARETYAIDAGEARALEQRFGETTPRLDELLDLARKLAEDPDVAIVSGPPRRDGTPWTAETFKHALAAEVRAELPRRLAHRRSRSYTALLTAVRDAIADPVIGPPLVATLRDAWRVALIDEFQDTDAVQWDIFRAVFADTQRLWLIGDPKQAIYGFRGADLITYFEAAAPARTTPGEPPLTVNRRADPGLVDALNHLFARADLARPFLDPRLRAEPVTASTRKPRLLGDEVAPFVITHVPPSLGKVGAGGLTRSWGMPGLAELTAADIAELLAKRLTIDGPTGRRPVAPRDIAVLVRTNHQARLVLDALRFHDVPGATRAATSVFKSETARSLGRTLGSILDPDDHGRLRRALLEPLRGYDLAGIAELGADVAAYSTETAHWQRWHRLWHDRGFAHMFRALVDDTAMIERLLGLPEGRRRVADLLQLGELLRVEAGGGRGPHALVRWLAQGGPGLDAEASASRLEGDEDAVQICTIHRSKGLEYGIVFCPYLWEGEFVHKNEIANLRRRAVGGHELALDDKPPDDARIAAVRQRLAEEALRLVYVALTRARHRCVLYWGRFQYADSSPLTWLLHQDSAATDADRVERTRTRYRRLSGADLRRELASIADRSQGSIEVRDATTPTHAPIAWRNTDPTEPLRARPLGRPGPYDSTWRRASFSALTRESAPHLRPIPPIGPEPRVPLHDVPGFGTRLGDTLHDVLETADLQRPDDLPALLSAAAARNRYPTGDLERIRTALLASLATPLFPDDADTRLDALAPTDRRAEIEFHLPIAGGFAAHGASLLATALADALAAFPCAEVPADYPDRVRALAWPPLRGFLTGHIDLLARFSGRYVVIDYKSNDLGPTFDAYSPAALATAMGDHHYVLQGLLYLVATRRMLRLWLADFDESRHLGGLAYLFLRGITPTTGPARGVWRWNPPIALLDALDASLRGE